MSEHPSPGHADTADATHDAGHHDAHGHETDTLGPVDWRMWAAGIVGVIAAAVVTAGFVIGNPGFQFLILPG
jgi:hypothetical protein